MGCVGLSLSLVAMSAKDHMRGLDEEDIDEGRSRADLGGRKAGWDDSS